MCRGVDSTGRDAYGKHTCTVVAFLALWCTFVLLTHTPVPAAPGGKDGIMSKEKKYLLMPVTEEARHDFGLEGRKLGLIRDIDGQWVQALKVEVTPEVYNAYMQPFWREKRRRQWLRRCPVEGGKRCPEKQKCVECGFYLRGGVPQGFSYLEDLEEEGYVPESTEDAEQALLRQEERKSLLTAIRRLNDEEKTVLRMMLRQKSNAEIGEAIGRKGTYVKKQKRLLRDKLKHLGYGMR